MQPIDTYEEYCAVKERESKLYSDVPSTAASTTVASSNQVSAKAKVTAASIMRHVKWKLGELTDAQFYAEEYQEAKELE